MTEYKKPSDVMEAVGVSGVLSAGLAWHVIGQGLAWAEFEKPADAVKYTMTKRGKGRKYAVMTFTPGEEFSGVVYLTNVKRGLDAGQVITENQLLDLYHGQEEKPAAKTIKPVKTLTKPAAATTQKRPKSKSRLRLGASRAAIKTLDTQAADFKAFCEKINAGRKVPYSKRNCALLFDQSNGKATEVRGFRSWKAAGRVVKKGSKALIIEAPKMIKTTDENGKHKERLICTPVCVFDVSQTEVLKENKGA